MMAPITFMMDDQDVTKRTDHSQRGDLEDDFVVDTASNMAIDCHFYCDG
jgi:hypothetical protein